ncbi:MAG TPA: L,D-transpeptidase [Thermoleophilia bacterium]|nr:L,D-transpeptidase [Thermoleophilia bacterium]
MRPRVRDILLFCAGLAVVLCAALGGYAVVRARAAGGGRGQSLAPVATPSALPTASAGPAQQERWMVGVATQPFTAYKKPSLSAKVLTQMPGFNSVGYPTVVLVDQTKDMGGSTWRKVWLDMRPNGTQGWVPDGPLALYPTTSKIVIDLSQRRLTVYRRGGEVASFPVAVGAPGRTTPTGFFYVTQKLRPPSPNGVYGVLQLGTSAYQHTVSGFPGGGPVGIHGTNEDALIGKAISHGCVRMHNKDILEVSRLVPTGSPVIIQK